MQGFTDELDARFVGNCACIRVTNAKNVENETVSTRKNVRAQDINWNNRKRAGDFGQQLFTIPSAETDDAVSLRGESFPVNRRNQRDRKSTRLNSSHVSESRMPSSA